MALIHIAGKSYELIFENRNGWNVEAFRNRYSDVLERYDYIVGDWGYNQLRLKGFFRDGHQKATKDTTFSYATDYINEYCNFGCAYFILEKKLETSAEVSEDDIFLEEVEMEEIPFISNNEEKVVSIGSVPEAKPAQEPRKKQSKHQDEGIEKYFEKMNDKAKKQNNRGSSKSYSDEANSHKQEGKRDKDSKSEGKSKRKEHFHRKGNRSGDKKPKGNKHQVEQLTSMNEPN